MKTYHDFMYDTEFLEEGYGQPIYGISIGIVHAQSGKSYYAVNADMHETKIKRHPWLAENVWPYLPTNKNRPDGRACRCRLGHLDRTHPDVKPREQIAAELGMFVRTLGSEHSSCNRLWAWFSAYDHVVLSQFFGRMIDLPSYMPMFTRDLKVVHAERGYPSLPEQTAKEHHALEDARHNVEVARALGVIS